MFRLQGVSLEQVGAIETEVPGIAASPVTQAVAAGLEFEPSPPIIRDLVLSDMKILTTREKYPLLNNFTMLLGLSDRLMRTEAEFFRIPHITRILWGGHRVVYIFTEATGDSVSTTILSFETPSSMQRRAVACSRPGL